MLLQNTQASFPRLTCSSCGGTAIFRLPGVTERTRYTCPRCCDRMSAERENLQTESNLSAPKEDPEVRQIARQYEGYGGSRVGVDDLT
jgi:transposase-like protein